MKPVHPVSLITDTETSGHSDRYAGFWYYIIQYFTILKSMFGPEEAVDRIGCPVYTKANSAHLKMCRLKQV